MHPPIRFVILLAGAFLSACTQTQSVPGQAQQTGTRPNILLIVFEDMGQRVGAFGDAVAHTPILDALAEESVRFPNTFTTSGVCAPSRASLITGVHQQSIRAQHMRTRSPLPGVLKGGGPIEYEAVPPPNVKAFPELLRAAGYYTVNNAKTDYQFGEPFTIWDESGQTADWANRAPGQPFFAMITLMKTHESYLWPEDTVSKNPLVDAVTKRNKTELKGKQRLTNPSAVDVPPYLPNTPVVRADIARHYDNIAFQEQRVQQLLGRLKQEKLLDSTVVIVTTDHGDGLPRMKRSIYDSGIRVPMIIRFPDLARRGEIDQRLVSFVDLAPTILELAGQTTPPFMQGRPFISQDGEPRQYIFAAADRHDKVPGRYRAVRDRQFKYIRNYMPGRAFYEPSAFRDVLPTMRELWRLNEAGELTAIQQSYFDAPRPADELYDLNVDPDEVVNLAQEPRFQKVKARLSQRLDEWLQQVGDDSAVSEAEMIEQMWPGMVQPNTHKPNVQIASEGGQKWITLSSHTEGASIGYRWESDPIDRWRLYSTPVTVLDERLEAKAIRYGYAPSDVLTVDPVQKK